MKINNLVKVLTVAVAGLAVTWACKSTSSLTRFGKSPKEPTYSRIEQNVYGI